MSFRIIIDSRGSQVNKHLTGYVPDYERSGIQSMIVVELSGSTGLVAKVSALWTK